MSLDAALLTEISRALTCAGVEHGALRAGRAVGTLNEHVTDGRRVFVKVAVAPGSGVASEPEATAWAYANRLAPARALTDRAITTDNGIVIGVYEWIETTSPGALVDQVSALTALLTRTHAATPGLAPGSAARPAMRVFDAAAQIQVTKDRLSGHYSETAANLIGLVMDATETVVNRSTWDNQVPVHGDAHVGNLASLLDGTYRLVDWEALMLAPAEWDIAQLVRTLLVQQPTCSPDYRVAMAEYALASFPRADLDLVDAIMRIRACTWAALLIRRANPTDGAALLDALDMARTGLDFLSRQRSALAA